MVGYKKLIPGYSNSNERQLCWRFFFVKTMSLQTMLYVGNKCSEQPAFSSHNNALQVCHDRQMFGMILIIIKPR